VIYVENIKQIMETIQYFVSLGAGTHQIPLIRAAKNMGLRVIAVDKNIHAPGFEYSDIQVHLSITKPCHIIRILGEELMMDKIAGVAARSYGLAQISAAMIAENFKTPYLSVEKIKLFRNKRKLKDLLKKKGVHCPHSYSWKNKRSKEVLLKSKRQLIVRPAAGSHGKTGIRIIKNKGEIKQFLKEHPVDREDILVEDLISGNEYTVIGYVQNGRYMPVTISDKIVSRESPLYAELIHRFPSSLSAEIRQSINEAMQKIVDVLELDHTALVAEFIIPSRGKLPSLVECSPEIGGEYIADYMIPAAYGEGFFEKIVSLHLANYKSRKSFPENKAKKSVIIRFMEQKNGVLESLEFPEIEKTSQSFLFSRILKKNGEKTFCKNGNKDRLAVFGLQGPVKETEKLLEESEAIVSKTVVSYKSHEPKSD